MDQGNRAPSAYHVQINDNQVGASQRARQEHAHGATLTREKQATHAFTRTKTAQKAVAKLVEKTVQQQGVSPETALRREILDGTAKASASAGAEHLEVFNNKLGKGNPHRSGGRVRFAEPGSPLSDYDQVSQTTQTRKREETSQRQQGVEKPAATTPSVTGGQTDIPSPSALAFNRAARQEQREFVSRQAFATRATIAEEDGGYDADVDEP